MDSRFQYHFDNGDEGADVETGAYQRYTIDKGVNSAKTASFVVEGHQDDYVDLGKCYLKTVFRLVGADGSALENADSLFLGPHFGSNLWSQVSVSLNNTPLPAGNDYPYTALLIDLLGASPGVRDEVFNPLAGWSSPQKSTSKVAAAIAVNPDAFEDYKVVGKSSEVCVFDRIRSDFMMSCAQLLPPQMQLGVTLTRSKDSFVLCDEASTATDYRIEVVSVSLYVKRVLPNPAAKSLLDSRLSSGGKLHYQRLHNIAFPASTGTLSWSWHNCFNNVLPRRVFVALVSQEGYFGSYGRLATYLESADVRSVRFCQDGREIMPEPYSLDFIKYKESGVLDWEKSDARSAFAGLCQTIGVFDAPRHHVGIRYLDFVNGSTVYAVGLDHSDRMSTRPGSLDVHIEFRKPVAEPLMVMVLGEYPKTLAFDGNRQIVEI